MTVLAIEQQSSSRAVSALKNWILSPAFPLFNDSVTFRSVSEVIHLARRAGMTRFSEDNVRVNLRKGAKHEFEW